MGQTTTPLVYLSRKIFSYQEHEQYQRGMSIIPIPPHKLHMLCTRAIQNPINELVMILPHSIANLGSMTEIMTSYTIIGKRYKQRIFDFCTSNTNQLRTGIEQLRVIAAFALLQAQPLPQP